ncbi:hypothetical protein [Clostridium oceanicum]|uniref:Lipoprotein n=1 Tax=Clostridium oceanicum TaxID=1543 RepID=A0ABP3UXQ2_9CLOT
MLRSNAKFKICLIVSTMMIVMSGCSRKNKLPEIKTPNFKDVIIGEKLGEKTQFYSINNGKLNDKQSVDKLDKIQDLKYNSDKKTYIFIQNNFKGKELTNNKIEILKNDKKIELDDFYYAEDIKLSKDGSKLAYRSFAKDNLNSAEGLKVFDIKSKKLFKIKSKVIVSGNLYSWLNENEILYYGIIPGKRKSAKVYKYNFNTNKEEEYIDNIKGYCTDFILIGKDLLYISSIGNESSLNYYDKEKDSIKIISKDIDNIHESIVDKNKNVYLIANNKLERKTYLYSFLKKDMSLNKLTYDFPTKIDTKGGIGKDSSGNIYFLGNNESNKDSLKNDVYMYNRKNNSVQIVSEEKSLYNIFQNKEME